MIDRVGSFLARWKWPLLLLFVILAGYTVGKDRAVRDNARDAAAAEVRA